MCYAREPCGLLRFARWTGVRKDLGRRNINTITKVQCLVTSVDSPRYELGLSKTKTDVWTSVAPQPKADFPPHTLYSLAKEERRLLRLDN